MSRKASGAVVLRETLEAVVEQALSTCPGA
jgi:hypothetical protein